MGKQQRKLARRAARTSAKGPMMPLHIQESILFGTSRSVPIRGFPPSGDFVIDEATDFDAGRRAYQQIAKGKQG